jgi:hypothetical protein
VLGFNGGELVGDGTDQALVARETEDVVDTGSPRTKHQLVAGKARIGAEDDLHPRPPGPDLANARDLGHGTGRAGRDRREVLRRFSDLAIPTENAPRRRKSA